MKYWIFLVSEDTSFERAVFENLKKDPKCVICMPNQRFIFNIWCQSNSIVFTKLTGAKTIVPQCNLWCSYCDWYFFLSIFCSDKKGGKGKDHRNDSSDEEDSPQSGKIASFISFAGASELGGQGEHVPTHFFPWPLLKRDICLPTFCYQ